VTFAEFFAAFWWLIFPIFGMAMAFQGANQSAKRTRTALDLVKSYIDQGKEPPPEILKLALREEEDEYEEGGVRKAGSGKNSTAWSAVTFAALAAGFGTGWYVVQGEDYAFAFLIVTVTMAVLALGSLLILIFGRK
jgi:Flp pilus assembly protein TadB